MLDERGIEYETYDPPYPEFSTPTSDKTTRWGNASYREWPNGTIRFSARGTTPEQAIAATLGPGTCRMESVRDYQVRKFVTSWGCVCSECGGFHEFTDGKGWSFCPSCGARVVSE